jgi:hypothetical protein
LKKYDFQKQIIVFCHKIDEIKENVEIFVENVIKALNIFHIPIFFTSLKENGNDGLIIGIQYIIEKFSSIFPIINEIFIPLFKNYHIIPLYLLDRTNFPIMQFNTEKYPESQMNGEKKSKKCFIPFLERVSAHYSHYFHKNLGIFLYYEEILQSFIITLDISNINRNFSLFIAEMKSLELFDEFRKSYQNLIKSYQTRTISSPILKMNGKND